MCGGPGYSGAGIEQYTNLITCATSYCPYRLRDEEFADDSPKVCWHCLVAYNTLHGKEW